MKKINSYEIVDVFLLHEWCLKWGGIWPLKKDRTKCSVYLLYCILNMIPLYFDLVLAFKDISLLVENLLETLVVTVSVFMTIVIRFHPKLTNLVVTIKHEIASDDYLSNEERYLYYGYNRITNRLVKIAITASVMTVVSIFLRPLEHSLYMIFKSLGQNVTLDVGEFGLPFKGLSFLHITDLRIYFLIYFCRTPLIYLGITHTFTICFVLSMVLHVCGRMAVIARRAQTLQTKSKEDFDTAIRSHVQAHLQIIKTMKTIESTFQYILLFDLVQTSVRLGLSSYMALTSKDAGSEFIAMCTFASYAAVIFLLLYVYCFVGEYLTQESMHLTDAYYYCNWQDMPLSCKSSLMICMICSQNHLTFTAGKFYKFSLYGFTGIVKTSMAYMSMLRAVV